MSINIPSAILNLNGQCINTINYDSTKPYYYYYYYMLMQNYGKAIDNQRRIEFRKENSSGKDAIKDTRFLLLRNAENLTDSQQKNQPYCFRRIKI
jgi:hypothetical protein